MLNPRDQRLTDFLVGDLDDAISSAKLAQSSDRLTEIHRLKIERAIQLLEDARESL